MPLFCAAQHFYTDLSPYLTVLIPTEIVNFKTLQGLLMFKYFSRQI